MTLSFPSPETIARAELPNGITLLVYENHSSPAVVIGGYVWAGSLSEPDEKAGLAAFTAGMLMRGTENRAPHAGQTASRSNCAIGLSLPRRRRAHTSRFVASRACISMNSRRRLTSLPARMLK